MIINSKKIWGLVLICFLVVVLFVTNSGVSAATYAGYIFGYFTEAQYGLNLAYSTNGRNWTALNGGKAVLVPSIGIKGIRDPHIRRKQNGGFVITATDMKGRDFAGNHSQNIYVCDSPDLCSFSGGRFLKVNNSTTMHAWAPEVFYDYNNSRYGILWSGNTDRNRLYVNYTTDFKTVTSNQVFFDPGYNVIDGSILQYNGTAYLFYKDERVMNIKVAKSSNCQPGSFSTFTGDICNSPSEGPVPFMSAFSNTWFLYADRQNGKYECWNTSNLNATSWTRITDISLPGEIRHGNVVAVTQAELDAIRNKWK